MEAEDSMGAEVFAAVAGAVFMEAVDFAEEAAVITEAEASTAVEGFTAEGAFTTAEFAADGRTAADTTEAGLTAGDITAVFITDIEVGAAGAVTAITEDTGTITLDSASGPRTTGRGPTTAATAGTDTPTILMTHTPAIPMDLTPAGQSSIGLTTTIPRTRPIPQARMTRPLRA